MAFWSASMPLESNLSLSRCRTMVLQLLVWAGVGGTAASAVVINHPPSLWEHYQGYVLGSSLVISTLLVLVGSLLIERRGRKAAEADLKAGEERFRVLVENAPEAILVFDVDSGLFVDANPKAEKLLGCSRARLLQTGPEPFFGTGMTDGRATPDTLHSNNQRVLAGAAIFTIRDVVSADGRKLVCEARIVRLPTKNGNHVRVSLTDITERRRAEAAIEQLAFYDVLTSLANRRLLRERLQHALVGCARGHARGALLYLDLDNFKIVNDMLGQEKGDQLLLEVAKRLQSCIREMDTAARLGGDEFVVMLEDLNGDAREAGTQALGVGEKILAALEKPYVLNGKEYRTSASIGVTLFESSDDNADVLLQRADLAMYQAKAAGRNALRFFNPEMQAAVTARADLESDLRKGLALHQFLMHLQPQVDSCGKVTGAEALMRWDHPTRGMVSPIDFISLAEDTGLIIPMGEWILETACKQLLSWSTHDATADLTLSVNVSVRQFHQVDFVAKLLGILDRTQANPLRLKLELTETMLVEDVNATIAKMILLRAHGVGFSIDDFGTGYSSLSYLKRLPLDQLKIDQSFVRDMLTDDSGAAIARAVITLGESMGLAVIAEGVETQEQRDFLEQHGCHAYQGYFFSRPLSQSAFATYLDVTSQVL